MIVLPMPKRLLLKCEVMDKLRRKILKDAPSQALRYKNEEENYEYVYTEY